MLIGMNITSAASFRKAEQYWNTGLIDFFELLIDNFLHLDPTVIVRGLGGRPVALHIMSSRFLHRSPDELAPLAERLRALIAVLRPLHVSDHLAVHEVKGQQLPGLMEVEYTDGSVLELIAQWRDMLGQELLLENFASSSAAGADQVGFFEKLQVQVGIPPLFDISNAIVSAENGGAKAHAWLNSNLRLTTCHIGGYRPSELDPSFMIDSHDSPISTESWQLLAEVQRVKGAPATLVIERVGMPDDECWADELRYARRQSMATTTEP